MLHVHPWRFEARQEWVRSGAGWGQTTSWEGTVVDTSRPVAARRRSDRV